MNKSAFSVLKIKAIDNEKRIIRGIASTPTVDRQGDIVEPLGMEYETMPKLLLYHNHQLPVGNLTFLKKTEDGVEFEASIPEVPEFGIVRDRVNEAWHSLKYNLISAVSIGFRVLEHEVLKTGGWLIKRWELLELSLVPVPAQQEAMITGIKSIDDSIRNEIKTLSKEPAASTGRNAGKAATLKASEKSEKKPVKIIQTIKENKMSISNKLKQFRETLVDKQSKLVELAEKSADETFEAAEQEEFDTLTAEIEEVKGHIKRLEVAEEAAAASAKAVTEESGKSEEAAAKSRQGIITGVKSVAEAVPGLGFTRIAKSIALAKHAHMSPIDIAEKLYPDDKRIVRALQEKAAIAAGNTTDPTWASPLVRNDSGVYADFAEFLRPATILGKFGQNGVPGLRNVPFRTALLGQTSGGSANWVGEGDAKPLTKFDFAGTTLDPLKLAAIAVITKELLQDSSPSAELLVRDGLRDALVAKLDNDFIAPSVTANAGINPASITNAATPIPSSGDDAEAVRCDVRALLAGFIAANNPPSTGVFVMPTLIALALSQMQNPLGQTEFPGIGMTGGVLLGFPVIVSDYMPAGYVALINAGDIYYGDGEITVDMSDQASLQMDSTPDNPTTGSTVLVSLWQRNLVGFLVEKRVNYKLRRPGAVQVLSGVTWGACSS